MARKVSEVKFTPQKKAFDILDGNTSSLCLDLSDEKDSSHILENECVSEFDEFGALCLLDQTPQNFRTKADVQEYIQELESANDDLDEVEMEVSNHLDELQDRVNELKEKQKYIATVAKALSVRISEAEDLAENRQNLCPTCHKDRDR